MQYVCSRMRPQTFTARAQEGKREGEVERERERESILLNESGDDDDDVFQVSSVLSRAAYEYVDPILPPR